MADTKRRRSVLAELDAPFGHLLSGFAAFAVGLRALGWPVSADLPRVRRAHSRFSGSFGLPNWSGLVFAAFFFASGPCSCAVTSWGRVDLMVGPIRMMAIRGQREASDAGVLFSPML